jgi:hypothetical protein
MANLRVAAPELLTTHADWTAKAAAFAGVAAPRAVASVSASAAAVAAIHARVAETHAMFGQRLAETAAHVQRAAIGYVSTDEDQAAGIGEGGGVL